MTKMINNFLTKAVLVGAAAFAAFSCSREVDVELPQEISGQAGNDVMALGDSVRLVHFIAQQGSTKAQFGTQDGDSWPTLWTTNDSELKLSLNFGSAQTAGVTPSEDFRSATFNATIDFSGTSGPYTYYAVSPSSAAMALSPSREAWKVSIPCVQTPTAASADEGAIILASASASYATMDEAEVIDLYFDHLTAYGRMSLANFNPETGETVSKVELTVTTPIVGDWYWKCELEQGEHTLIDYGASSTLTLNTSSTENIWFGCAPVEVSGEVLVVNVYTDAGVYKQETLFPDGCKFTAGQVAMFAVDMTGAGFTAAGSGGGGTPVTVSMDTFASVSGYVDGDENISYEASQGDAQTAPVVNSEEIRIYQNGGLLTVTANNGKTITNVTIGSSMATKVQVRIDSGSFGSDNSISAGGTYSTGTISASTVVFKCTGTSKTARLYLNSLSVTYEGSGSGGSSAPDPLLQETVYGCYLGSGLEWTLDEGTDQVTRSYDSDGVLTYTLINPSDVEELEISGYTKSKLKGDSFNVSVNWRKGTTSVHSANYSVTLIKEQGPKVWLSDGNGKGFIIKK